MRIEETVRLIIILHVQKSLFVISLSIFISSWRQFSSTQEEVRDPNSFGRQHHGPDYVRGRKSGWVPIQLVEIEISIEFCN